jgi:hypothetical protein
LNLSVIQTALIYVGVPVAVLAVVYAVVYAGSSRRGIKRYRPGRPFEFRPVWFLSAPEQVAAAAGAMALAAGESRAALSSSASPARAPHGASAGQSASTGATGGASDNW